MYKRQEKEYEYKSICKIKTSKEEDENMKKYTDKGDEDIVYLPDRNSYVSDKINYKRDNYFKDNLFRLFNRDKTVIPNEILEDIKRVMKMYNIDESKLDHNTVRSILKKIKKPQYYKHIQNIICSIVDIKFELSENIIVQIYDIFLKVQESYSKYKTKEKHFLSYKYTIYKILEILGHTNILKIFPDPILKNRDIISEHDQCWKKICEENNFPFRNTLKFNS